MGLRMDLIIGKGFLKERRMYKHVCDICKEKSPDAKIKYKYRAKRFWCSFLYESGWERIELCQDCLEKIIQAEKEKENG